VSTPAAAGLPTVDAEEAGNGADKDHARVEKLNAYIRSLKQHITDQKQLFRNCMLESEKKSERISELNQYIIALEEMRTQDKKLFEVRTIESARKSERIGELQESIQALQGTIRRLHEEGKNQRIHEWRHQDLLSQLRQAEESHAEQLAVWMEQVNALQKRIHVLERRDAGLCPSLRR
jgi:chromosome segregation ATPase